jgi:hypothetical protein
MALGKLRVPDDFAHSQVIIYENVQMPSKQTKAPKKQEPKPKAEQERQLAKELEMSFPASDPPASTQPGSGITGPEVVKSK